MPDMENLGKQMGSTVRSVTNRIQEIEERISGAEDSIEEIESLDKENTKHYGNLGHHEKSKHKNNKNRRKRTLTPKHKKYI